jgi:hypothetical protein
MGNPRGRPPRPPLTIEQILAWADAYRARTGEWPTADSSLVTGEEGDTWAAINTALAQGHRGLPGGDTLSRLLKRERGMGERRRRPFRFGTEHRVAPPG